MAGCFGISIDSFKHVTKKLEPGVRATASQVQQKTEELSTLGLAFFLDNGSRREGPSADKHRGGMWEVASKWLKYVSASVTKVHSDARNVRALAVPWCQQSNLGQEGYG